MTSLPPRNGYPFLIFLLMIMLQGFNKCKPSFKFEDLPRNEDAISCRLQSEYRWICKKIIPYVSWDITNAQIKGQDPLL